MDYTVRICGGLGNECMHVPDVDSYEMYTDEGYVEFCHENGESTTIMLEIVKSIAPEETA